MCTVCYIECRCCLFFSHKLLSKIFIFLSVQFLDYDIKPRVCTCECVYFYVPPPVRTTLSSFNTFLSIVITDSTVVVSPAPVLLGMTLEPLINLLGLLTLVLVAEVTLVLVVVDVVYPCVAAGVGVGVAFSFFVPIEVLADGGVLPCDCLSTSAGPEPVLARSFLSLLETTWFPSDIALPCSAGIALLVLPFVLVGALAVPCCCCCATAVEPELGPLRWALFVVLP